ncbi:YitT family protein [Collinsella ihumii]|uniref:YitT family protein n=1 Tax=Collinsella ihumii TaxID=1720204 RepID=A0ABT7XGN3_9ACTN|nr:YitT family protein [Collinsella ihumii]MDN0064571.1 YitT family protein [Collinsella ihumii]
MAEDWDRSDGGTYVRDADARARIKDRAHEREMRQGKKRIGNAPVVVDAKKELERLKSLRRRAIVRRVITLCFVIVSAFLQAYAIQVFVQPAGLLSSGFTGLAILVDRITSMFGFSFPTSLGMIVFNIPVAILCWKSISKRFVVFSMIQVFLSSTLLRFMDFDPMLREPVLLVVFGGFIYGLAIAIALRGGASTAGTDFISLMVSNKTGKSIWGFIFAGNCVMLLIFGYLFGWTSAAFSIIFQFISTKTIETFYHRYDRMTLRITTKKPDEVLEAYTEKFRHGSSCFEVIGGYSRKTYWIIETVVSSYEVGEIVALVRAHDDHAVINVFRSEDFFGRFYRGPVD